MLEITHHDDGKEKFQSHTVGMADRKDDGNFYTFDFSMEGYGESYDEALEDFKQKFDEQMCRLQAFEKMLFGTDALIPIKVDCFGKPIE